MKPRIVATVGLSAALVCAAVSLFVWRAREAKAVARGLIDRGHCRAALEVLWRSGWLLTNDSQARLLMAEAIARDESGSAREQALSALAQLRAIPASSPLFVEACVRAARLEFLVLHRPMSAERWLGRALDKDPHQLDALTLLWKIFDLTGRSDDAEPLFEQVYARLPQADRRATLRAWYESQIDTVRSVWDLDSQLGFRTSSSEDSRQVELRRLSAFHAEEPDQPVLAAALAQWFQREGDLEKALRVLEDAAALSDALRTPYFGSTMIAVLIDAGQMERADRVFRAWTGPRDGHAFWKMNGLIQEELHRDYRTAAIAYEKALSLWPGAADWRMQFRLAACLALSGDKERADGVRSRAAATRDVFSAETQKRLRRALEQPHRPESRREIEAFYRVLERERELSLWREAIASARD